MRGLKKQWFNPFLWSKRQIKVALAVFYMIAIPAFIIVGLQPAQAVDVDGLPSLSIPTVGIDTPVAESTLDGKQLSVPDRIAAAYSTDPSKLFLMGHSATVFKTLKNIRKGDEVYYNGNTYVVSDITTKPKSEISMKEILAPAEQETVIIMTCAGRSLGANDYTHRLIVTAERKL
ncbi:class F sortase [Candidatus Saccharibacteria bacterium]|nr:class F sortase [Candidatus Saccharibacteria bacterium]MBR3323316.1 class F sortase [Candidatus Saccharibacteria bacterium]